jgi:hypothetical protein
VSNAAICKVCYPLVKGAEAMCREHMLEAALCEIDEINGRTNPEIQKVIAASIGLRVKDLQKSEQK